MAIETPNPRAIEPDLPEDLAEFIRIATAKRPEDRFASCAVAAEFLRRGGDALVPETMEMSILSLTYLPGRREEVQRILQEAADKLHKLRGVHVFEAHQVPPPD